ncbi:hypothetical protein AB1Y20_020431 [Prymnesium parvum]|uniref:Nucleotide-diphospho-sugar transferase domain-containing protein n=1 Tax=Prymnesium parvum TaxID=97485 RepID=A0AB34JWW4_PRYPA
MCATAVGELLPESAPNFEVTLFDTKGDWMEPATVLLMKSGVSQLQAQTLVKKVRAEGQAVIAHCSLGTCMKVRNALMEIGLKAVVQEQTVFLTYRQKQQRFVCETQACWHTWLAMRADKNRMVTLSFVNFAFVPFWYNLKCSLNSANVKNDILIGSDKATCEEAVLMKNTACVVGKSLFFEDELHPGAHPRGTVEFAQLVRAKTKAVLSALERGYSVLYTDADIFWVSDPRPWLVLQARLDIMSEPSEPKMKRKKKKAAKKRARSEDGKSTELQKLDALVQSNYHPSNDRACNSGLDCKLSFRCDKKSHEFGKCAPEACSGFYMLRAGDPAIGFLKRVQELIGMQADDRSTEQWAFNAALSENGGIRGDLKWELLSLEKFPHGEKFFHHIAQTEIDEWPLIIHNNWINGASAKEKRFSDAALWIVGGTKEQPNCKAQKPKQKKKEKGGKKSKKKTSHPSAPKFSLSMKDLKRGHKKLRVDQLFNPIDEGLHTKDEL